MNIGFSIEQPNRCSKPSDEHHEGSAIGTTEEKSFIPIDFQMNEMIYLVCQGHVATVPHESGIANQMIEETFAVRMRNQRGS